MTFIPIWVFISVGSQRKGPILDRNKHAKQFVKVLRTKCGSYREMYIKLHKTEPSKRDVQTLTNYVNRGNFNTEFMLDLIEAFDLEDVTLGEFFKGKTKD